METIDRSESIKEKEEKIQKQEEIQNSAPNNKVFGELVFDYGWKGKTNILLWDKTYEIIVDASAYYESEKITTEQETVYMDFNEKKSEKQKIIETLLLDYFNNELDKKQLSQRLTPKELVIEREGEMALLFEDKEDLDNGLAVVLYPDEEVMTQDEYL